MGLIENMYYVRELAQKNAQYDSQIRQLMQERKVFYTEKQEINVTKPSVPIRDRLFIFIVFDLVFGFFLNKILSYILTLMANGGMTKKQALEAGYRGYYVQEVFFPVGIVLAIPFALLVMFLITKFMKRKEKKQYIQMQQANKQIAAENAAVISQNQVIREHNIQIEKQINSIKNAQNNLIQELNQIVPEYPSDYLSPEIVNFVIHQIQSGNAASINQAIVQYVAIYEK